MAHLILPSTNVYFIRDNKVLLSRRLNTGWLDGHLCAPGGHVEIGETPKIAAVREVKEELGIDIGPNDLEFICVAARNASPKEYVAYEFAIRNKKYKPINAEPNKCSELVWVSLSELPGDVISDFSSIIKRSIIGSEKYLELGYS